MENEEFEREIWENLKNRINTDKEFTNELQAIYFYYERKLLVHAQEDSQKEFLNKHFEEVVFSQFFQGYLIMRALLDDPEVESNESIWTMNDGLVKNAIASIMKDVFSNEETEWTFTEIGHDFGIQVLDTMNSAFDIVKSTRNEIAYYGAYKALIEDSRYTGSEIDETVSLRLGTPFDLEFLSPQVFMQAQYSTSQNEIWDLFLWSAIKKNQWVGSAQLTLITSDELPVYLLEIKLNDTIMREEKYDLTNQIVLRLSEDIRELLQTRLYHTTELEILIPANQKETNKKEAEVTQ